jgi:heme/copper-type cytochrome/quinol oxidase subunit 1
MPRLSVWFVRASLIYLLLGFTFGALILAQKGISYYPPVWNLFPIHTEFLLIGWFVQLAMGVAFWILPRFSSGPPRGNVKLIWISFMLLNLGILCGVLRLWIPPAALIGRAAEAAAGIVFAIGLWRRVKPHGV